jgi:P-type E1-E2 ATPase
VAAAYEPRVVVLEIDVSTVVVIVFQEGWRETRSQDLTAGDIVQVNDAQQIPADMVLLSSSHPKGSCYITTANLDGCAPMVKFLFLPRSSL